MPHHPRRDRSPADDGLYLVPYWVQGGRTWFVILAALLGGGAILLSSAAQFGRRGFSSGFAYGAATIVCALVRDDKLLPPDVASTQLQALKVSFARTGVIDISLFQDGVSEVVASSLIVRCSPLADVMFRPDHRHIASSDVGLGQSMNGFHPCRS